MSLIEGRIHYSISESEGRCACGWVSSASTDGRRRAALKAHLRANQASIEAGNASADALQDIEIWEHKGFVARVQRGLGVFLAWFMSAGPQAAVGIFFAVWLGIFLTTPVRELNRGWVFAMVSVILSVIVFVVYANLALDWQRRLVAGPAVFGKYGGLPSRIYSYGLRGAQEVTLEFAENDRKAARDASDADADLTEDLLRWSIETEAGSRMREPLPDDVWREKWNQILLGAPVDGLTFKDAIADNNLSFNVVVPRLLASHALMGPIVLVFNLGVVAIAVGFVQGSIPLLALVQIGAILALILAVVIVIYHRFVPNEIRFSLPQVTSEDLADELDSKYSDRLGIVLKPSSIEVTPHYRGLIQRFHSVIALLGSLTATLVVLILSVFIVFLGSLWAMEFSSELVNSYGRLLIVIASGFIGFAAVLFFMFMAIERGRVIISAVASAIALAIIPPLVNYAASGTLQVNELWATVSGVVGGTATIVANAVVARKP